LSWMKTLSDKNNYLQFPLSLMRRQNKKSVPDEFKELKGIKLNYLVFIWEYF